MLVSGAVTTVDDSLIEHAEIRISCAKHVIENTYLLSRAAGKCQGTMQNMNRWDGVDLTSGNEPKFGGHDLPGASGPPPTRDLSNLIGTLEG